MKLPGFLSSLLSKGKAIGGAKDNEVLTLPPDILVITQSNHLYNSHFYRLLLKIAVVEALICLTILALIIFTLARANPVDRFFVSAANGRLERVMPLDTPLMNNDEILSNVAANVSGALTFGYIDREQRMRLTSDPFASGIHAALLDAVIGKETLSNLARNSLIFKAAVDPSIGGGIVQQGRAADNIYRWQMQIPIMLSRISANNDVPNEKVPWHILVEVQRSPSLDLGLSYQINRVLGVKQAGPAQPITANTTTEVE